MKKLTTSLLVAVSLLSAGVVMAQKNKKTIQSTKTTTMKDEGLSLANMDRNVRPQDDFYNYVNGSWMKTAKIPSDKSSWGAFNELAEATDNQSLTILNNILKENYPKGSEGQKIQDLYGTFMDMNKRNADGLKPVQADIAKIDAIKNLNDLQAYLKESTRQGFNPFYEWGVDADLKNSKMNAIYLGSADLGLGRDYYQKDNEANAKAIAEYQKYIASILDVLGYKNSPETAKNIFNYEKQLAKSLLTVEQIRDANLQYNPETMDQLKGLVKNVDLPAYLKAVGVNTDKVIVGELNYIKNLDTFLTEQNIPVIKDYLKFHLISSNAGRLDKKLDDIQFNFYSKYLRGQKEQRPMNKRGLSLINGVLGEAFGKLYVDKYFPQQAKTEMLTLIDYLKKSFAKHINELTWMSSETKVKALDKLNKFTVKVGYPDKWKDYSKLEQVAAKDGGTLYGNLQKVSEWSYQRELNKIGKPVDKAEWGMSPQTVNAYYNPTNNEIVFPAAILQPPFFNFKADPAVNFGGIGAVIGHEMSHGFDDSGATFDGDGNLVNWWSDADLKNFKDATTKLANQFSKYEPVKGTHINGEFTNGENIGDLGGVNVAYDALQMYLKDKGNPGKISGFTQDQRFFMSWATVWRTLMTEQATINQIKTNEHAPGEFRAFGPLVNTDAFYKAFDVKPGDKLYKKPEDRVKIW
ncbi:M13 family metallopeptidase [Elizabethkingia meningoseptica]|uniref:Endothelin-converting protein n=1 Tax=Elizabethkingia meningoseptica TaxID=238 RepID=A0A1V3U1V3_ELIME|nr:MULTISPECIES: M13 family metallopeptidase [Elizabethkingia]AQX06437.1 endothelin-converting protein [Elizabethkingia meningoseptica]AQX13966.1 endothelin-converting protein [Elizabethkingia meningoseptica]AQX48483.1 endothelin-converting protein [Elizabethkingia meningoseptica]EJK5327890.1 M13 family metallopeptidase [Elizabethkingia meningoseptica]EOR28728.1 metalloendopeptidase [Elizabethkingia meningoseptica ATCC 13253 = NBRC 12535]